MQKKIGSTIALLLIGIAAVWFLKEFLRTPGISINNSNQVVHVESHEQLVRVGFEVTSVGDFKLTHVDANCKCAVFTDLPISLRSGETVEVFADIDLSKSTLPVTRQFLFYVNPPVNRAIATVEILSKVQEDNGQ